MTSQNVEVVSAYIETVTDAMILAYKALAGIIECNDWPQGSDMYLSEKDFDRLELYMKENLHEVR